ncbi:hypothetical protein PHMEG_0001559 [Phytophthora megakarya]|uniref:Uncharacterized protein n=1 Tax=Phytophthora megakarya TaxID=4795 RepID=A0A225X065_9STRA|nr:hypothetical protein PHMEG_0001559 [Phytophthora megakarya]
MLPMYQCCLDAMLRALLHINGLAIVIFLQFAVHQLRELSDSGIYTTLSLDKIHAAATEVSLKSPYFRSKKEVESTTLSLDKIHAAATELGDFHYVIHLQMSLKSPYFRSKKEVENFEMMVLESKPRIEERASGEFNATRSIAIDEFPEMDEDAIETFWVQMVEEKRRRRRELFEKWEREGVEIDKNVEDTRQQPTSPVEKVTKTLTIDELQGMPTKQLRQLLATPESTAPLRAAISAILDERLTQLEQHEEAMHAQNHQYQKINLQRDEL